MDTKEILLPIIQKASQGMDAAINFSQQQLPDIVHQLLVWKLTEALLSQFIALTVIVSVIIGLYRGFKNQGYFWDTDSDVTEIGVVYSVAAIILIPITTIIFLCNFDWLEIWLTPKIYLIEYAASLIKGG